MEIIETSPFSRQRDILFSADEFRQLCLALVERPEAGAIIKGGGGVRKLRWAMEGRGGKRDGARVIYYWAVSTDVILLLVAYPKGRTDTLSDAQVATLRTLVKREFG